MNVTFVTAFLRPPSGPVRPVDVYLREFSYLASAGVPLWLYHDGSLDLPCVEQIAITRTDVPADPVLPSTRTSAKDTVDYFCIQAMKLELLAKAAQTCTTPYLAWVDFGVFHMLRDKVAGQEALRRIASHTYPVDRILAPGCWPAGSYGVDAVCWRFCGSFLLGHRDLFAPAYARQQAIARSIAPKVTWEVNLWSQMDDVFRVYLADHNDSLFSIPDYKMSLVDLVDNHATDKNTTHSYLEVYEPLFAPVRDTATHVLELGIGEYAGSLRLFRNYFTQAEIHGIDIVGKTPRWGPVLTDPRVKLHTGVNGYTQETVDRLAGLSFDILLDDGPHTLESMLFVVTKYLPLLKTGGVLIIEDVQDISWIEALKAATPEAYKPFITVHDRRSIKGRYDDILFIINTRSQETPA
jgi:hypothetical protein